MTRITPALKQADYLELRRVWEKVLPCIASNVCRGLLEQQGQLLAFDGQQAEIGVSKGLLSVAERKMPSIETAFEAACGRAVHVTLKAIDLEQVWEEVLERVQPSSTGTMLRQQCKLMAFNGEHARISARSPNLFKMVKDRISRIEKALQSVYQRPIKVTLEVLPGNESP